MAMMIEALCRNMFKDIQDNEEGPSRTSVNLQPLGWFWQRDLNRDAARPVALTSPKLCAVYRYYLRYEVPGHRLAWQAILLQDGRDGDL